MVNEPSVFETLKFYCNCMMCFPEKPQIIDIYTSSDSTVEEDDRVVLECAAGGIPTPRISWQMRGGGVLPTGGRVLQVRT